MGKLLSKIFNWLGGKAAALVLILAVLIAGAWFGEESRKIGEQEAKRSVLVADRSALQAQISDLERTAGERARKAQAAIEALRLQLKERAALLERARTQRQKLWEETASRAIFR